MNEEEKQAIGFLKHSLFEYEEIDTSVLEYIDKNHKIIYKLILKQHKEIEKRLKEIDSLYKMMSAKDERIENLIELVNQYNDMQYIRKIEEKYISKDKIKELIKEKAKTDTYNFRTIAVKDIKELLGETND